MWNCGLGWIYSAGSKRKHVPFPSHVSFSFSSLFDCCAIFSCCAIILPSLCLSRFPFDSDSSRCSTFALWDCISFLVRRLFNVCKYFCNVSASFSNLCCLVSSLPSAPSTDPKSLITLVEWRSTLRSSKLCWILGIRILSCLISLCSDWIVLMDFSLFFSIQWCEQIVKAARSFRDLVACRKIKLMRFGRVISLFSGNATLSAFLKIIEIWRHFKTKINEQQMKHRPDPKHHWLH